MIHKTTFKNLLLLKFFTYKGQSWCYMQRKSSSKVMSFWLSYKAKTYWDIQAVLKWIITTRTNQTSLDKYSLFFSFCFIKTSISHLLFFSSCSEAVSGGHSVCNSHWKIGITTFQRRLKKLPRHWNRDSPAPMEAITLAQVSIC